jgi:hypothetical protein
MIILFPILRNSLTDFATKLLDESSHSPCTAFGQAQETSSERIAKLTFPDNPSKVTRDHKTEIIKRCGGLLDQIGW